MSQDPIMRGRRWEAFYNEEGGIKDMLAEIKQVYLSRLAVTDPANVAQLQVLAQAHTIANQFESMVTSIVRGAAPAEVAQAQSTKMQGLSEAKRRRL